MKYSGIPHSLLMIRPHSFGYNVQTADTNAFQDRGMACMEDLQKKALLEFDMMVETLLEGDIHVRVFDDDRILEKPDAIFPNNWLSLHPDGKVILYPMMASSRRSERRRDIVEAIKKEYAVTEVIDLSSFENDGKFLEGTGSIIYDHSSKVMYACESPRTNSEVLKKVSAITSYKLVYFQAVDEHGLPVYHTNVMMSVGENFAVICMDAIRGPAEDTILETLSGTGHQVIDLSYAQMNAFAGNIFEVMTHHGQPVVLMSKRSFMSLLPGQLNAISKYSEILQLDIDTIERAGGGGVRCMIAGNYLPK